MPRKRNPKRRRPQARRKVKLRTLRNPRSTPEARHQHSQAANPLLKRHTSPSRQLALSCHLLSPRRNLPAEAIRQPLRPLPPEREARKTDPLRSRTPPSRASQEVSDKTPLREPQTPQCASVRMQQLVAMKLKKSGKKAESRRKSKPRKRLKKRKKPEKRSKSGTKSKLKKRDRPDR